MVVVFISTKVGRGNSQSEVKVAPTPENGLKVPSAIRCMKIATLEKKIAIGEIGNIDRTTIERVNRTLCKVLGL